MSWRKSSHLTYRQLTNSILVCYFGAHGSGRVTLLLLVTLLSTNSVTRLRYVLANVGSGNN